MAQSWSGAGSAGVGSSGAYGQQQYSLDRHAYLPSPLSAHPSHQSHSSHSHPPHSSHGHTSALHPSHQAQASSQIQAQSQQSQQQLSMHDDYDDPDDDLGELSGGLALGLPPFADGMKNLQSMSSAGGSASGDKQIRRRSSKACDQCRKSKCKCERANPNEPCRNCVMLGTACTFLGPSRKRGPPKGYIDAIEARLHQTEALIGILLGSRDARARGVLEDIQEDPLAKEIIARVDNSPYGAKGRSRGAEAPSGSRARAPPPPPEGAGDGTALHSTHPSNEWQDSVIARLNAAAATRNTLVAPGTSSGTGTGSEEPGSLQYPLSDDARRSSLAFAPPALSIPSTSGGGAADEYDPPSSAVSTRRTRRRLDHTHEHVHAHSPSTTSHSGRSRSRGAADADVDADAEADESASSADEQGEDELALAVGQLSLNEDAQLRYHGKASGLHLLGVREREDGRHEGGIWRFPKARVWPPLPPGPAKEAADLYTPRLPDEKTQELLLELYFTYVHPALPIVHKQSFLDDLRSGNRAALDSPYSADSQVSEGASPLSAASPRIVARRRVPTLLLLAMFASAARYVATDEPPPGGGAMWPAGDTYLEDAKVLLDRTYAQSCPSTCQALLLLAYREVGIGAMAQAWLYVGMAIRMAQDLGMHKRAETWRSIGRDLFTPAELQERRRIWYGCVVMDKYVSAYIGRPVAIFEQDFDTELPSVEDPEELELWQPHPSPSPPGDDPNPPRREMAPVPGHIISCFNESVKLSLILSTVMQTLYCIRPHCCRSSELSRLDKSLSKWYHELPEHLQFDPASPKHPAPPPHILTLHMQYWCTVILLHRPFIRHIQNTVNSPASSASKDSETPANSRKNYDMCVQAANHVTSIVSVYVENYCAKRSSVYLSYYVFTAGVMHVATLMAYPGDPQARIGLNKCMDVLKRMQNVWPSAWRALELLQGSKANQGPEFVMSGSSERKRQAEHSLDADDTNQPSRANSGDQIYRQQQGFGTVSSPGTTQQGFNLSLNMPPVDNSYLQSYDRWPSDGSMPNFGGNLSTSVLPQQYSTGLVDERAGLSRASERQGQRYPQYWNDYSALGQIDATTYNMPVMGDIVPQHTNTAQGDQPSLYVQDQYNMFGNIPPNNQQ
ncbi:hypothetical protein OBBRIDRAFT_282612 [Obba rivulosa]|uniref:Zn(2)-C6 fungal-type domain-containing protein n=1 Tax=Obba rivulosa TaxID=1052685 RepID=A0A8E2DFC7_9APHY|nr:hypothetical protein OBBRIDRAFT_282612 [Obba rivulosa]